MISPEQRELRRKFIGSSDASAVMGIDEYRKPADVFLEKTGKVEDWEGNAATDAGSRLEPVVREWAAAELGKIITPDVWRDRGHACANLDGLILDEKQIVECKTTGIVGPRNEEYGDAGTDVVPEFVMIQVHHQFYVLGPEYRIAWVPVLIGGVGFRMYRVDRLDDLVDAIEHEEAIFWNKHVLAGIAPEGIPSYEVLKRIRRVPNKVEDVPDELVRNWKEARQRRLDDEKVEEAAQAALIAAMGDAEAAVSCAGMVTYLEQTTNRKAQEAKVIKFRTLREKKGK